MARHAKIGEMDLDNKLIWESFDRSRDTNHQIIEELNWRKAKALGALGLASTGLFGGTKADAKPEIEHPKDSMIQTVGDRINKLNYTKDRKSGRIDLKPSGGNYVFTGSDMEMSEKEYLQMVEQYKSIAKEMSKMKIYKDILDSIDTEHMVELITTAEQQGMFDEDGPLEGMNARELRNHTKNTTKNFKWVINNAAQAAIEMANFFEGLNRAGYIDWSK